MICIINLYLINVLFLYTSDCMFNSQRAPTPWLFLFSAYAVHSCSGMHHASSASPFKHHAYLCFSWAWVAFGARVKSGKEARVGMAYPANQSYFT